MRHLGFFPNVLQGPILRQLSHPLLIHLLDPYLHQPSSSCKMPVPKSSLPSATPATLFQFRFELTHTNSPAKSYSTATNKTCNLTRFSRIYTASTWTHLQTFLYHRTNQTSLPFLQIVPAFPPLPICLQHRFPLLLPKLDLKPLSWLDSIYHWNSFLLPHP